MRSHDSDGDDMLQPAIDWFEEHHIPLYGINENPDQKEWTTSPKVYGDIYIDDVALGAPLKTDESDGSTFIDWDLAAILLFHYGCLTEKDIIELVKEGVVSKEHVKVES